MASNKAAEPVERKQECSNPHCGCTLYYPEYESDKPVWKCANCPSVYPRRIVYRRKPLHLGTLRRRALLELWEPINTALDTAVKAGKCKSGALLVYSSTFNYHMDALMEIGLNGKKLTYWDVRYHAAEARKDLEKAKQFVADLAGQV